ncbi:MAG: TraR/DksA family transcriptional regulator [Syntrophobacteraceae bacterium]
MRRELLLHFRDILMDARRDILVRVQDLESRWQEMSEREIEIEEVAQRAAITLPYDRLGETGKASIEHIDLALNKIVLGEYGVCEHCGDEISEKRLAALPWTRLCIDCAREFERRNQVLPPPGEVLEAAELPDEYQGLSNNQIMSIIYEQIQKDERIETRELDISLRDGVLYLEGAVAGEPEHQILLQTITDILGFSSVVDHLSVNEVLFEREDRTPRTEPPQASATLEDRLFYDQEDLSEDLFEAGDEIPYSPPVGPLPHQEYPRRAYSGEHTI